MSTTDKPVRKFPPLCWSRDEALVLVEAYKERWYALDRAYLRTADWEAVAEEVGRRCLGASPAKTSTQCRHKIEKLRQRHRAEKKRSLSFSGPFFSSWFYYEAMEAMEYNGSKSEAGDRDQINSGMKNSKIRFKPVGDRNLVTLAVRSKNTPRATNDYSSYLGSDEEHEDDGEFEDGFLVETPIDENLVHTRYRSKDLGKNHKIPSQNSAPPRFQNFQDSERPRKISKIDGKLNHKYLNAGQQDDEIDEDGEIWVQVPKDRNLFRGKYSGETNNRNLNPNFDNGCSSKRGIKRENVSVAEMVTSIKHLGDGFMKMERLKMDMAREIEKMRMEAEMKRNELILESQKQIVEAFVKGLIENNNKNTAEANNGG